MTPSIEASTRADLFDLAGRADQAAPHGEVVVGYDGSASGKCAVKYAAGEAARAGLPLVVLTVDPRATRSRRGRRRAEHPIDDLEPARQIALTRLHYPELVVHSERIDGNAVDVLVERASGQAMVVVGSRGLDRSGRLVLGSTSVALAGRSQVPVVIVPSGWPGWRPRGHSVEPVVVGFDPARDGQELLDFASAQAASRGLGLVTVTAAGPHPVPALMRASLGTPLLVVGRHHAGRFGFRIGSVTREVLHRAEVPVAVVPLP